MKVLVECHDDLELQPVHLRHRVAARLHARDLDRSLAAGASPDSSVRLAVHAARLYRPGHRSGLAHTVRRLVAMAEQPTRLKAPVSSRAVREVTDQLEAVASRLASPGPVEVRGVAKVRSLLADGTGPLYRPSGSAGLRDELLSVLRAFDPPD
jgi:hypothetical protein